MESFCSWKLAALPNSLMVFIILIAPVLYPACILQKKLTKREDDSFYIPVFSYDHSCGHFSVQQSVSLVSDLGRGGKWNGSGLWKVFNTGAYSLPFGLQGIPTHGIWPIIKNFSFLYLIQFHKLCQPTMANEVCSYYRTIAFLVEVLEGQGSVSSSSWWAKSSVSAVLILRFLSPPLEQQLFFWPQDTLTCILLLTAFFFALILE